MKKEEPSAPLAYNVYEAARLLSISHWTLRKLIRERKIKTRRLDRAILITRVELERFLNEGDANEPSH